MKLLRKLTFIAILQTCILGTAYTAPADHAAQYINTITDILQTLEQHGALWGDATKLSERIQTAVCQAVDPQAEIVSAQEAQARLEENSGVFYGIGIQVEIQKLRPRVLKVLPDSPASSAGLAAGMWVEKIDGADTLNMSLHDVVARLRGRRDQSLTLEISLASKLDDPADTVPAPQTVTLQRAIVQMPVTGTTEQWPLQLAYIKVNGIYEGSGQYIAEQFHHWNSEDTTGIILDLRDAGGADLDSVAVLGSMFTQQNQTLFTIRCNKNNQAQNYVTTDHPRLKAPLMVLIDSNTRAAAAILATVLRNARGAMLIGTPSQFDMLLRDFIPLPNGKMLYAATQHVEFPEPILRDCRLTPDVVVAHETRIQTQTQTQTTIEQPKKDDIFTKISEQERQDRALRERIGDDTALRRAADILLGLKALGIKTQLGS